MVGMFRNCALRRNLKQSQANVGSDTRDLKVFSVHHAVIWGAVDAEKLGYGRPHCLEE